MIHAPRILIYFIILVLIVGLIFLALMKINSGIKVMLLGINITLFGGIFAIAPNLNLGGIELFIVCIGLLISIMGLKKEN